MIAAVIMHDEMSWGSWRVGRWIHNGEQMKVCRLLTDCKRRLVCCCASEGRHMERKQRGDSV